MSLLLAAAAASAHGWEQNPRLSKHAEGRERRRPSSGCRAPFTLLGSPSLLNPQRPGCERSRATARLSPPRLCCRPRTQFPASITCGVCAPPRPFPTAPRDRTARPRAENSGLARPRPLAAVAARAPHAPPRPSQPRTVETQRVPGRRYPVTACALAYHLAPLPTARTRGPISLIASRRR